MLCCRAVDETGGLSLMDEREKRFASSLPGLLDITSQFLNVGEYHGS